MVCRWLPFLLVVYLLLECLCLLLYDGCLVLGVGVWLFFDVQRVWFVACCWYLINIFVCYFIFVAN